MEDTRTSKSVERRDFRDVVMLDAKMTSALKDVISNLYFRRRVSFEEQRAHQTRQISGREGRLLTFVTIFEQLELMMQPKAYQICSISSYAMMTFRISIQDRTMFC